MRQATKSRPALSYYTEGILRHDRIVLAQAITLVESTLPADQEMANQLVNQLLPETGKSIRIGITGSPGVGKSSFIETLGEHIIGAGKKIAVLTIDPSSQRTKGSILGDKTRMLNLSRNKHAFIRPSSAGNALGGVAHRTREAMLLCEAAGFNVIIIETVGVGQSEIAVKNMVDFFLLLILAGSGDELQGIKKGIIEMADTIIVTKSDGDNIAHARAAQAEYQHALHLLNPPSAHWTPQVLTASAFSGSGIPETWKLIEQFNAVALQSHAFESNRKSQNISWFEEYFQYLLQLQLESSAELQTQLNILKQEVAGQRISPNEAARQFLHLFNQRGQGKSS